MEESQEQEQKQGRYDHIKPWMYKKGQSGNPGGRPLGSKSLKTYVKEKFAAMSDEEREIFLEGVDKKIIWEMGEDKAKQATDVTSDGKPISIQVVTYANTTAPQLSAETVSTEPTDSTG